MTQKPIIINVRVKELRKQQAMTQEVLADLLGVSRQSVIALEGGKYLPSLPIAIQLGELFALPLEEIFICDEAELAPRNFLPAHYPPINLKHEADRLILEAAVAGYTKDEVDVEVEPERVTITGDQLARGQAGTYLAREMPPIQFRRQITLPAPVNQDRSLATITNGLLTVTMPLLSNPIIKKKLTINEST